MVALFEEDMMDVTDSTYGKAVVAETLYHVMWRMNQRCNYKCAYCFREGVDEARWQEHPDCGKYTPEHISSCFDNTGRRWRIHMTGGEPLLYPQFVELAVRLAARHQLSINTNLSTDNVFEFGCGVRVEGVYVINATAHIAEQEKRRDGISKFIERALFLQDKGFRLRIMYVTYPPLLGRMQEDMRMFQASGIRECVAKVFRGWHEGKLYPGAYSSEQKALIRSQRLSRKEQAVLDCRTSFQWRRCTAGHSDSIWISPAT
jgi:MoaA/NifB/PqqE/SkfB family radical SAM enzyme